MTMPASDPSTSWPATWRKYGRMARRNANIIESCLRARAARYGWLLVRWDTGDLMVTASLFSSLAPHEW
jgi:hypothetical protein